MGREWLISTADLLYARCLRDAGHCLWISDPTIPVSNPTHSPLSPSYPTPALHPHLPPAWA